MVGSLSRAGEPSGARAYARALCQRAQLGEFDEPLAELAEAPDLGPNAPPLVGHLRDTVAHELTRRIDQLYAELTPRALNLLTALTTEEMAVDRDEQLQRVWCLTVQRET